MNNTKNIVIKGFYTFQTYEYTVEQAFTETNNFLHKLLKHINNISFIRFIDISTTSKKDDDIIYIFFSIKSVDINNNFIQNKYIARTDVEDLERLLGTTLSIKLE